MGNFFAKRRRPLDNGADNNKPSEPAAPDSTPAPETPPAPTVTQPGTETAEESNFAQQLLDAQNVYRAKHDAPAMSLDVKLCNSAQEWADHMAEHGMSHAQERDFGENLAWSSAKTMTGAEVATMWYDEIKKYNFNKPGYSSGTGHFTQVVWKASTEFGAGINSSEKGTFVVGRYTPTGNITNPGMFEENVLPGK